MIDFHTNMVSALNTVLPTHYEMALTSNTSTPCISYMETNNYVSDDGDTLGYSVITYQVKVWANDIALIQKYAREVDAVLRPLGLTRTSSGELYDNESSMIQKIMSYEGLALENY
jgi:hypothetical protein